MIPEEEPREGSLMMEKIMTTTRPLYTTYRRVNGKWEVIDWSY